MEAVRTTAEGAISIKTKQVKAFGTEAADALLQQLNIHRRTPKSHDVEIEILYCGVCHSDLHTARNEWHGTILSLCPGHEIVGKVVSVGNHVAKFKVGDLAAVGCMVDSCRECDYCKEGLEQYCEEGNTGTYNSPDKYLAHKPMAAIQKALLCMKTLFYAYLKILIWQQPHHYCVQVSRHIHHLSIGTLVRVKK